MGALVLAEVLRTWVSQNDFAAFVSFFVETQMKRQYKSPLVETQTATKQQNKSPTRQNDKNQEHWTPKAVKRSHCNPLFDQNGDEDDDARRRSEATKRGDEARRRENTHDERIHPTPTQGGNRNTTDTMPKVGKSKSFWTTKLVEFAKSKKPTLGQGQAPGKGTREYTLYQAIKECPRRKATANLFGKPTKCSCGYHRGPSPGSQQQVDSPAAAKSQQIFNPYKRSGPQSTHQPKSTTKKSIVIGASFSKKATPVQVGGSLFESTTAQSEAMPQKSTTAQSEAMPQNATMAKTGTTSTVVSPSSTNGTAIPQPSPKAPNTGVNTDSNLHAKEAQLSSGSNNEPPATKNIWPDLDVASVAKPGAKRNSCPQDSSIIVQPSMDCVPQPPEGLRTAGEIRDRVHIIRRKGFGDLYIFGPTEGKCLKCCNTNLQGHHRKTKTRLVHTAGWPYYVQGLYLSCNQCSSSFLSYDARYIASLPHNRRTLPAFFHGSANGIDISLIHQLRLGTSGSQQETYCRLRLGHLYDLALQQYEETIRNHSRLGLQQELKKFPPFPEEFVPKSPALLEAFIADYCLHKDSLLRELKAHVSMYGLSVDHKAGDVKRVRLSPEKGEVATQTFTVVGDFGIILNHCVVPDTHSDWTNTALQEILERHGDQCPKYLYVDCGCCNGRLRPSSSASSIAPSLSHAVDKMMAPVAGSLGSTAASPISASPAGETKKPLSQLEKVLDALHMIMRITRQCNAEHPRLGNFARSLSKAIYVESKEDVQRLEAIRHKFKLKLTPAALKIDRQRFVRHTVGPPIETCAHVLVLMQKEETIDQQARLQAQKNAMDVDNITVAHFAYPLITKKVKAAILQQCVHILNGCPQSSGIPYVKVGDVNYRMTGQIIPEYRYLGSTSQVEALHSVSERHWTGFSQIRSVLFDAKALWFITNYNRRRQRALGRNMSALDGLAPDETAGRVPLAKDASGLYFGFDYMRKVTGEVELSCENVLNTLADTEPGNVDIVQNNVDVLVQSPADIMDRQSSGAASNAGVHDHSLQMSKETVETIYRMATSVPGTPLLNTIEDDSLTAHTQNAKPSKVSAVAVDFSNSSGKSSLSASAAPTGHPHPSLMKAAVLSKEMVRAAASGKSQNCSWIDSVVESIQPHRHVSPKRNVARRRKYGRDVSFFPPDFNETMTSVWEKIWAHHSGNAASSTKMELVTSCLKDYTIIQVRANAGEALLPTNYALVNEYLNGMQRHQTKQFKNGTINQNTTEITKTFNALMETRQVALPQGEPINKFQTRSKDAVNNEVIVGVPQSLQFQTNHNAQGGRRCSYCRVPLGAGRAAHLEDCPKRTGALLPKSKEKMEKDAAVKERQKRAEETIKKNGWVVSHNVPANLKCLICGFRRDGERHIIRNNKVMYCPFGDTEETKVQVLLAAASATGKRRKRKADTITENTTISP